MYPEDVDPESGCRLPLPRREELDDAGQRIYDSLADPEGGTIKGLRGPGGIAERIPRKWMVPIHGRFLGSDDQSIRWTWPNVEIKKPAISNVQHVHPLRGTACVGRRRPVLGRRGARLSHGCGKGGG